MGKVADELKRQKKKVASTKKADENYDKLDSDRQRVHFKGTRTGKRRGLRSRYS